MSHRKISRSKRKSKDGDQPLLKAYKLNKISSEAHESVYEIDINSSISFENENRDCPMVKVCIANVAPRALERKSATRNESFRVFQNALIESHYPRFRETDSESEPKVSTTGKVDFNTQTSQFSNLNKEKQEGSTQAGVVGGSEAPKPGQAIESLSSKAVSRVKKPMKNETESGHSGKPVALPDKELVHLHRHEHHHHYHFDKKAQRNENDPQVLPSKTSSCESAETVTKERQRLPRKKTPEEDNKVKHSIYYTCESKSNANFTRPLPPEDECQDPEKASYTFKSSRHSKVLWLKSCTSIESVPNKSCLIETHTYSDTELVRCDSEDLFVCEDARKRDSKTTSKTLNHSAVADQKPSSKVFFTKSSKRQVSGLTRSCLVLNSEAETSLESGIEEGSTWKPETKKESQHKYSKIYSRTSRARILQAIDILDTPDAATHLMKRSSSSRRDACIQNWAEKIKFELEEIKKELRTIEREFLKKKSTPCLEANESRMRTEDGSGHEISVFSSRTFILKAENFYIIEESDSGPFSDEMESFAENDELSCAETDTGKFLVSPNGSRQHFEGDEGAKKRIHSSRKAIRGGLISTNGKSANKEAQKIY